MPATQVRGAYGAHIAPHHYMPLHPYYQQQMPQMPPSQHKHPSAAWSQPPSAGQWPPGYSAPCSNAFGPPGSPPCPHMHQPSGY
eukprot:380566-Pleurochrysis_carterae.AAC.1